MFGLTVSEADLKAAEDAIIRAALGDLSQAVAEETRGVEQDLEGLTRVAVRGRLWRAWASQSWPKGGAPAVNPKGEVYVNGGERTQGAITFVATSGRIRTDDGEWITIPTEAAKRRMRPMTVTEYEAAHGVRLDMVYTERKFALLVDNGTPTSASNKAGRKTKARKKSIVVFILVPFVDFHARFSIEPVAARREQMLANRAERLINERSA